MKKIFSLFILALAIFLPCVASAHEIDSEDGLIMEASDQVMPQGLIVSLTVDIYEEGGYVCGIAHNAFTIGFGTVYTAVFLYSSPTYTENKDEMTYESHNSISDLNLGKSLITKAEKGDNRYWRCFMKFKNDNSEWVYAETDTAYF